MRPTTIPADGSRARLPSSNDPLALSRLDASHHLVGSFLIEVDGNDTATSTSYFHAQHVKHDTPGGDLLIIAGTYRDRLRRVAGRWRVVHRTQEYSWRQGNPAVTKPTPPTDGGS